MFDPGGFPQPFGRFRLVQHLGSGGMAQVFLAEVSDVDGPPATVALKVLHPHLATDETFLAAFIQGRRLGGQLNHPNIVKTIGLGEISGLYWWALDYVPGITLGGLLRYHRLLRRALPVSVSLQLLVEVCRALDPTDRAWDSQRQPHALIHGNLRPDNIFLGLDGAVKISEIGLIGAAGNRDRPFVGMLEDAIGYLSPERARGEPFDRRSDLFSMGALLFELMTLTELCPLEPVLSRLRRMVRGDHHDCLQVLEGQPKPLSSLLKRLLHCDPKKRPASAKEVGLELTDMLATLSTPESSLARLVAAVLDSGNPRHSGRSSVWEAPRVESISGDVPAGGHRDGEPVGKGRASLTGPSGPPGASTKGAPSGIKSPRQKSSVQAFDDLEEGNPWMLPAGLALVTVGILLWWLAMH